MINPSNEMAHRTPCSYKTSRSGNLEGIVGLYNHPVKSFKASDAPLLHLLRHNLVAGYLTVTGVVTLVSPALRSAKFAARLFFERRDTA